MYEWNADERELQPITETDYTPLLRASRELRVLAVDQFDDLVEGLIEKVQDNLGRIKKAEELAKS